MMTQNLPTSTGEGSEKQALNQRLEAISWALFLIMLGGIGLIPDALVPEGTWLVGVGLIMLGLNLARSLTNIPMSSGTLFLGALALIAGLASIFGVNLPIFPIALILLGLNALGKAFFTGSVE
jgi:VIT1/CCC1 family predicted Fe2+/Mn2+ transporter